jgi:hypothetical protein
MPATSATIHAPAIAPLTQTASPNSAPTRRNCRDGCVPAAPLQSVAAQRGHHTSPQDGQATP